MNPNHATLVKQGVIVIALLLALVGLQAWQIVSGVSVKVQDWEYMIDSPRDADLATRLQFLGAGGWEIVSARRATSEGATGAAYEMILRRPAVLDCVRLLAQFPDQAEVDRFCAEVEARR